LKVRKMEVSRRGMLAAVPFASMLPALVAPAPAAAMPASAAIVTTPTDAVVETVHGKVRGFVVDGIYTYKGVPYGADTSQARFKGPTPPVAWAGVRPALTYGPICPQSADPQSPLMAFLLQPVLGLPSEDCLVLNIWTPSVSDGRRPVMVWIHGGEFSTGSSQALASCDGENLARGGDVVVVSVNHRLNALGYLNLSDLDAGFAEATNAGMLDLVAALQWVAANIERFGGDPGQVTLFGQSGGGLKITTLCAMPAAKGLFHRAIVQSGSQTRLFRPEVTAGLAAALLDELGLTRASISRLRELPADHIVAAAVKAQTRFYRFPAMGANIWSLVGWAPTLDGTTIPTDPYDLGNRSFADVPLLVGSTRCEFNPALADPAAIGMTETALRDGLAQAFDGRADQVLSTFRRRYPDLAPVFLSAVISATAFNRANAVEQARAKTAQGGAAFLYQFDWETPVLDGLPHAYHCSELPFVFRNTDRVATATGGCARPMKLSDLMSRAWLAFARTGDPNHPGLPPWPKVWPGALPTLVFDDQCRVEDDADRAERAVVGRA
jgi:para-nitrobenzyl esterase